MEVRKRRFGTTGEVGYLKGAVALGSARWNATAVQNQEGSRVLWPAGDQRLYCKLHGIMR